MKSLQPQDLRLPAGTTADVQQINALKTLKDPTHGGTTGWFIDLIGEGLFRCRELATKQLLGKTVHQQTKNHNETEAQSPALASSRRRRKKGAKGSLRKRNPRSTPPCSL